MGNPPGYKKFCVQGPTGLRCFLCRKELEPGDHCFLVPKNCDETEKMQTGQEYTGEYGHQNCVRAVLGMDERQADAHT